MIGTTRSRVRFFMNRFRKLGFVEYNGRIRVHKSLLNVILHDQLPDDNAVNPEIPNVRPKLPKTVRRKRLPSKLMVAVYQSIAALCHCF